MRLERKESQLKKALNYVFKNSNNELFNENFYENIQEFLRPASDILNICLLYTSPSPRDAESSRMPSSA